MDEAAELRAEVAELRARLKDAAEICDIVDRNTPTLHAIMQKYGVPTNSFPGISYEAKAKRIREAV